MTFWMTVLPKEKMKRKETEEEKEGESENEQVKENVFDKRGHR